MHIVKLQNRAALVVLLISVASTYNNRSSRHAKCPDGSFSRVRCRPGHKNCYAGYQCYTHSEKLFFHPNFHGVCCPVFRLEPKCPLGTIQGPYCSHHTHCAPGYCYHGVCCQATNHVCPAGSIRGRPCNMRFPCQRGNVCYKGTCCSMPVASPEVTCPAGHLLLPGYTCGIRRLCPGGAICLHSRCCRLAVKLDPARPPVKFPLIPKKAIPKSVDIAKKLPPNPKFQPSEIVPVNPTMSSSNIFPATLMVPELHVSPKPVIRPLNMPVTQHKHPVLTTLPEQVTVPLAQRPMSNSYPPSSTIMSRSLSPKRSSNHASTNAPIPQTIPPAPPLREFSQKPFIPTTQKLQPKRELQPLPTTPRKPKHTRFFTIPPLERTAPSIPRLPLPESITIPQPVDPFPIPNSFIKPRTLFKPVLPVNLPTDTNIPLAPFIAHQPPTFPPTSYVTMPTLPPTTPQSHLTPPIFPKTSFVTPPIFQHTAYFTPPTNIPKIPTTQSTLSITKPDMTCGAGMYTVPGVRCSSVASCPGYSQCIHGVCCVVPGIIATKARERLYTSSCPHGYSQQHGSTCGHFNGCHGNARCISGVCCSPVRLSEVTMRPPPAPQPTVPPPKTPSWPVNAPLYGYIKPPSPTIPPPPPPPPPIATQPPPLTPPLPVIRPISPPPIPLRLPTVTLEPPPHIPTPYMPLTPPLLSPWEPPTTTRLPWEPPATAVMPWEPPATTVLPWKPPATTVFPWEPPATTVLPWKTPATTVFPWKPPVTTVLPWEPPATTVLPWKTPATTVFPWKIPTPTAKSSSAEKHGTDSRYISTAPPVTVRNCPDWYTIAPQGQCDVFHVCSGTSRCIDGLCCILLAPPPIIPARLVVTCPPEHTYLPGASCDGFNACPPPSVCMSGYCCQPPTQPAVTGATSPAPSAIHACPVDESMVPDTYCNSATWCPGSSRCVAGICCRPPSPPKIVPRVQDLCPVSHYEISGFTCNRQTPCPIGSKCVAGICCQSIYLAHLPPLEYIPTAETITIAPVTMTFPEPQVAATVPQTIIATMPNTDIATPLVTERSLTTTRLPLPSTSPHVTVTSTPITSITLPNVSYFEPILRVTMAPVGITPNIINIIPHTVHSTMPPIYVVKPMTMPTHEITPSPVTAKTHTLRVTQMPTRVTQHQTSITTPTVSKAPPTSNTNRHMVTITPPTMNTYTTPLAKNGTQWACPVGMIRQGDITCDKPLQCPDGSQCFVGVCCVEKHPKPPACPPTEAAPCIVPLEPAACHLSEDCDPLYTCCVDHCGRNVCQFLWIPVASKPV